MIAVGLALLSLGIADFVAGGLAGSPRSPRRVRVGIAASALPLLCIAITSAWCWSAIVYVTIALAGTLAWLAVRIERPSTVESKREERRAAVSIGVFVLLLLYLALFSPLAPCRAPATLLRALAEHPVPLLRQEPPETSLAGIGVLAFLAAPANALIRAILRACGTQVERSAKRLRGGRVIGMLERWLIFGFAVAGEPTAAALVVSAKSLVRFPELQAARSRSADESPSEIDHVTEYSLLGSLASWVVALVPVIVLRGMG